jgi:AcrR family transcriptional regulator
MAFSKEMSKRTRGALREATIELVGRQGYEATSVADICAQAGASEEEFEGHFADKKACVEDVWEAMTTDYICSCRGAYMAAEGWREGLRAAGYAALEWLFADEARTRFFLVEVMAGGEMVRARRDLMMSEFIAMLDDGRRELADPDSLSRGTAEGLTGAVYNSAIESIKEREGLAEARRRVKTVMHLIVLSYLGPEAAAEELEMPAPGEGVG